MTEKWQQEKEELLSAAKVGIEKDITWWKKSMQNMV